MIKRVYTEEQKKENCRRQLERRKKDPEKYRAMGRKSEQNRRLKRYGLTYDQYLKMLEQQQYQCAICGTTDPGSRDWHVDHCHTTGIVRGILCSHCNLMLGHAKDSITTLQKAMEYLNVS